MSQPWTDFASELCTAWLTAMGTDAEIGTTGTLGVVTRETLPAITDELLLNDSEMPYIGAVGSGAAPSAHGSMFKIKVDLQAVCVAIDATPEAARTLAVAMASRAGFLVWSMHGRAPGASGHSAMVAEVKVSQPTGDEDEKLLSSVTVSAVVEAFHYETT
jgi:hypothetical protein